MGDDGQLRTEALDVLGLAGQVALGDEQGEVGVLGAAGLDAEVDLGPGGREPLGTHPAEQLLRIGEGLVDPLGRDGDLADDADRLFLSGHWAHLAPSSAAVLSSSSSTTSRRSRLVFQNSS